MIKLNRYPKKGVVFPERGLRNAGNLFQVGVEFATKLRNVRFVDKTILQRKPFTRYSTQDFSVEGVFKNGHEYLTPGGTRRVLFGTNSGKVIEYLTASTSSERLTGLNSGQAFSFANFFDSVAIVNGVDEAKVGRNTTYQKLGSPDAPTTFTVSPSGASSFTGTYLHLVLAVIEVSSIGVVFSDWPTIVRTTPSNAAQFDVQWDKNTDSRVTAYYYFRTRTGATVFESVARIAQPVGAGPVTYTDTTVDSSLPVTVTGLPKFPPPQHSWGASPVAKYVVFSGNRLVYLNLSGDQNVFQLSRLGESSYDVEGVPGDGSTKIRCLRDGPITAGFPIGETGEGSPRANHLFIAQEKACYFLPETDPKQRLQLISSSVGCINHKAIAQYDSFLFFQSRRGVEFWPGGGQTVYLLSEHVKPIFSGGGVDGLTANQSDADIQYEIWENYLVISVRDSSTATGPNKWHFLDLNYFKRNLNPVNPATSARFFGPWDNTNLGMGLPLALSNGTLLAFDNENIEILKYDEAATQDYIDGTSTDIPVEIHLAPVMKEMPILHKNIMYAHVMQLTSAVATLTMEMEYGRVIEAVDLTPNTYNFEWGDIDWDDITWEYDTWYSESEFPFGQLAGKWGQAKIAKTDSDPNMAFLGMVLWYHAWEQMRTFR